MYAVFYASAGCLPDSENFPTFDLIEDAAAYILEEAEVDHYSQAQLGEVVDNRGMDDPRPNSLYRWSIEEVEADS